MKRVTLALVVMVVATVLAVGTAMAVVDDVQRSPAGRDAALDRALEELVSMRGGPPGAIAVVQRDEMRKVHTAGVAELSTGRPQQPRARSQHVQGVERGRCTLSG